MASGPSTLMEVTISPQALWFLQGNSVQFPFRVKFVWPVPRLFKSPNSLFTEGYRSYKMPASPLVITSGRHTKGVFLTVQNKQEEVTCQSVSEHLTKLWKMHLSSSFSSYTRRSQVSWSPLPPPFPFVCWLHLPQDSPPPQLWMPGALHFFKENDYICQHVSVKYYFNKKLQERWMVLCLYCLETLKAVLSARRWNLEQFWFMSEI